MKMASSLKCLVANTQFSVAFCQLVAISDPVHSFPQKIWGSLFSSFGVLGVLGGLCFQDTLLWECKVITIRAKLSSRAVNIFELRRAVFMHLSAVYFEMCVSFF